MGNKKFGEWAGREAGYKDFGRRSKVHVNIKLLLRGYTYDFDGKIIAQYPPTLIDEVNLHFKKDNFELDLWLNRATGAFRYLIVKMGSAVWSSNIHKKGDYQMQLNMLPNGIWVEGVFAWTKNYRKLRRALPFKLVIAIRNPKQILEREPKDVQTRLM